MKLINLLKEVYFNKWVTVQTVKIVNLLKEGYFNEWVMFAKRQLSNCQQYSRWDDNDCDFVLDQYA